MDSTAWCTSRRRMQDHRNQTNLPSKLFALIAQPATSNTSFEINSFHILKTFILKSVPPTGPAPKQNHLRSPADPSAQDSNRLSKQHHVHHGEHQRDYHGLHGLRSKKNHPGGSPLTTSQASVPNSTDIQLFPVLYHGLKEPSTEDTKAPTMKSEAPTTKSETPTMENEMNMETDKANPRATSLGLLLLPQVPRRHGGVSGSGDARLRFDQECKPPKPDTSDSNIFFFPLFPTDKKEQTRQGYQDEFEHLLDDLINGSFKPEVEVKFRAVHLEFGKPVDAEEA
ncbi:uncharacterized protein J3D65DRAFT_605948 [Phyllosticta citribraziliensis]|uniref:Uncharacterized protein n=1 Tax=Phyllosticta citribraziliensis TaxID=989973 RepID=A0ABR1LDP7_9PEZI